jgi:hypothetical protein
VRRLSLEFLPTATELKIIHLSRCECSSTLPSQARPEQ